MEKVRKLCYLRERGETRKLYHQMTSDKIGLKQLLDEILFTRDLKNAEAVLNTDLLLCLCDLLRGGTPKETQSVLSGSGWACTLLLVARIPEDCKYREKQFQLVPVLIELYKGDCEWKTGILNCLAVISYFEDAHRKLSSDVLDIFNDAKLSSSLSHSTLGAIGIAYVVGHIEDHPALVGLREPENARDGASDDVGFFRGLKNIMEAGLASKSYEGFQFDPCDLAGCVARLSKARSNRQWLLKADIIPVLRKALEVNPDTLKFMWLDRNKSRMKDLTMEILWDLSFNDEGVNQISADRRLVEKIKRLGYTEDKPACFECSAGIMWNIAKAKQRPTSVSPNQKKRSIMVSYAYQTKGAIAELCSFLRESANFDVELDVDKSQGIASVAEISDQCDLMIVCASNAYEVSASCRLEAEYFGSAGKPMLPVIITSDYSLDKDSWLLDLFEEAVEPIDLHAKPEAGLRLLFAQITAILRDGLQKPKPGPLRPTRRTTGTRRHSLPGPAALSARTRELFSRLDTDQKDEPMILPPDETCFTAPRRGLDAPTRRRPLLGSSPSRDSGILGSPSFGTSVASPRASRKRRRRDPLELLGSRQCPDDLPVVKPAVDDARGNPRSPRCPFPRGMLLGASPGLLESPVDESKQSAIVPGLAKEPPPAPLSPLARPPSAHVSPRPSRRVKKQVAHASFSEVLKLNPRGSPDFQSLTNYDVVQWLRRNNVPTSALSAFDRLGLDGKAVIVLKRMQRANGPKFVNWLMEQLSIGLNAALSICYHLDEMGQNEPMMISNTI